MVLLQLLLLASAWAALLATAVYILTAQQSHLLASFPQETLSLTEANIISNMSRTDFMWGAATASYQIEGAWDVDGKGRSIWDDFVRMPGKIKNGDTGDVACLSYYKYKEDVQLLKEMSVSHYRFSVSWPRVLPKGTISGGVNEKGIEYYNNLINELLANGIQPSITFYHWDLPSELQKSYNGFENNKIVDDFVNYADLLFSRFGDRVKLWITFNEPWIVAKLGYAAGYHAPGVADPRFAPYNVGHHMMLAHAKTYALYNSKYRATQKGEVGITLNCAWMVPKDPNNPKDIEAAKRALIFTFGWFADPVIYGNYPKEMIDRIGEKSREEGLDKSRLPEFTEEEQKMLKNSTDFLGLNLYTSELIADAPGENDEDTRASKDPSWPDSGSDWLKVTPFGLGNTINYIHDKYNGIGIIVTENGVSDRSGSTEDSWRVLFYDKYIASALSARDVDRCNLRGYFAWSLLDNFEWAEGYLEKFGLTQIDYDSPQRTRTQKSSFRWYRDFVRRQRGITE